MAGGQGIPPNLPPIVMCFNPATLIEKQNIVNNWNQFLRPLSSTLGKMKSELN